MRAVLAAVAALGVGCAEQSVVYPDAPQLELGFGEDALVPIADGDIVPITTGPQGGTIVWGAVSARYLDPVQLELVFSITPPEGSPSLRRVRVDLDGADDGFAVGVSLAHPVFLPDEDRFSGVPCVWRVEARDREGRSAADEKLVVPTRLP